MQEENQDQANCEREMSFIEKVNDIRLQIKNTAEYLKGVKEQKVNSERNKTEDFGEVMANLTLTYRHLEDASMRLGKTIQAFDGGVSVYDKETTCGTKEV